MNASPEDQRRLLDIAELDRKIRRSEHLRANPAEGPRIKELASVRQEQLRELTELTGAREDIQRELSRLESDVSLAEQRRDRDTQRLAASSNPKDAQALEHEIASLTQRLSDLEDAQLEVMGRLEEADAAVAAQQALIDQTTAEGTELTRTAKAAIAQAENDLAEFARDRSAVAGTIAADLLADYERRAARGTGAGLLRRGICEACQMMLSSNDISKIRQTAPEVVVSCPECSGILVRTEESGL